MEPTEHHLEVVRTARWWMLGAEVARPREIWFVVHGYGQLARRFLRRFAPLADGSRWIVAPEALNRFYAEDRLGRHGPGSVVGATWMTREDRLREIDDYVAYLDRLADTVRARLGPPAEAASSAPDWVVLGFSQGVATAARWSVLGRTRPRRLLLWGDFLPPDLPAAEARARWEGVEVTLVRGRDDGIFCDEEHAAREEALLAEAGLRPAVVTYPGGHGIDQETLQSLARAT